MSDLTPGKQRLEALRQLAARGPMGISRAHFEARYPGLLRGMPTATPATPTTATPRPGAASKATSRPMTRDRLRKAIATASRPEPTAEEIRTATHEAAHMVVAHVLGAKVGGGNVIRDGNRAGLARIDCDGLSPQAAITIALAGAVAARRLNRRERESAGDNAIVLSALGRVSSDRRVAVFGCATREAARLVSNHWRAIERVANRLVDKLVVSGEEVARLVRG